MSALYVVVLGSSSSAGTNLPSPATERYAALLQTWLRANRLGLAKGSCRVSVVALSGIGTYEQQATGTSIPGNRSGAVSINTSNNITFALAIRPKPDLIIYHQPASNMPEAQTAWSCSNVGDYEDIVDNEFGPITGGIVTAARSQTGANGARIEVVVLGGHPPSAAAKATNSYTDAQITGRHYLNQWYAANAATYGYTFIDYWDDVALGTNYNDSSHEVAPIYNAGDLPASKLLSDGVHMNAPYLSGTFEPNHLRVPAWLALSQRYSLQDVVA